MPRPLSPPIVSSATFAYEDVPELLRGLRGELPFYGRWGNPTVEEVEARLCELTGAEAARCFGSGMAAISTTLLAALEGRPRLLMQRQVYGGTHALVGDLLPRLGIAVEWFDHTAGPAAITGEPGVVYLESPTNPTCRVVDVPALAAAARARGALTIVDNTFATPILQRPLAQGADLEVHSATKYLGGHHDLIAGAVAGSAALIERVARWRKLLGGILDPFSAFLLQRGLRTLELRVRRQSETALALAEWLEEQPGVARVHYPGLGSHPDHALAARLLQGGFGGMLGFEVAGGDDPARRLIERLQVFALAASLGGTESLVSMPVDTSHASLTPAERAQAGVNPGFVRLSIGLEPFERLRDDLSAALRG